MLFHKGKLPMTLVWKFRYFSFDLKGECRSYLFLMLTVEKVLGHRNESKQVILSALFTITIFTTIHAGFQEV